MKSWPVQDAKSRFSDAARSIEFAVRPLFALALTACSPPCYSGSGRAIMAPRSA